MGASGIRNSEDQYMKGAGLFWNGLALNDLVSRIPVQDSGVWGAFQRKSPMGALAKGIPRNLLIFVSGLERPEMRPDLV